MAGKNVGMARADPPWADSMQGISLEMWGTQMTFYQTSTWSNPKHINHDTASRRFKLLGNLVSFHVIWHVSLYQQVAPIQLSIV